MSEALPQLQAMGACVSCQKDVEQEEPSPPSTPGSPYTPAAAPSKPRALGSCSQSCADLTWQAAPAAALPHLPIEVLEKICSSCNLQTRVSLASCCRMLWTRSDVTASPALWAGLSISARDMPAACHSLPGWLVKRWARVRHLRLCFGGQQGSVAAVLGTLCGRRSPLEALIIWHGPDMAWTGWVHEALRPLQRLTAITRLELRACKLESVPVQVSALCALRDLALPGNPALGLRPPPGTSSPFEPLKATPRLTRLELAGCGIRRLPLQLSCLLFLSELHLGSNPIVGWGDPGVQLALQRLQGSLTRLDLSACGLMVVPLALSSLTALAHLDVSGNSELGDLWEVAFLPLEHLQLITHLNLRRCPLQRLPAQLSALAALTALDLQGQVQLGRGGDAAWQQLARAPPALRALRARGCQLAVLPHQLSALGELQELDLSHNLQLGWGTGWGPAAHWQPLAALGGSLTRLSLEACGLEGLPPAVSVLSKLARLDLSRNPSLGRAMAALPGWRPAGSVNALFEPLRRLAALRQLAAAECALPCLPAQLAALPSLQELELSGNPALGQAEAAWHPLAQAPALTRLGLGSCGLGVRSIASVAQLSRLVHLDLSGACPPLDSHGAAQLVSSLRSLAALTRLELSRQWAQSVATAGGLPGVKLCPSSTLLEAVAG